MHLSEFDLFRNTWPFLHPALHLIFERSLDWLPSLREEVFAEPEEIIANRISGDFSSEFHGTSFNKSSWCIVYKGMVCIFIDRLKILAQGLLLHQALEREQSEFDPVLLCLDWFSLRAFGVFPFFIWFDSPIIYHFYLKIFIWRLKNGRISWRWSYAWWTRKIKWWIR